MPGICMFAAAVDAETARSPCCRFYQAAAVVVETPCCRAAARTPSPRLAVVGCAGRSRRHWCNTWPIFWRMVAAVEMVAGAIAVLAPTGLTGWPWIQVHDLHICIYATAMHR